MTRITEGNYAEEALLRMKMVPPNADGSIGVTITDASPNWLPWLCYFLGKRMDRRASFMRVRSRDGYMVPCANPADFDPEGVKAARDEYAFRVRNGEIASPTAKVELYAMSSAEREEVVARAMAALNFVPAKAHRYRAEDEREAKPKEPEARPLTDAEAASMRRLMGQSEAAE